MSSLKRFVASSQENAVIGLLILIGGVVGAKDVVNLVLPGEVGIYAIGIVFLALVASQLNAERRLRALKPIPKEAGSFHPFKVPVEQIWPRGAEADSLINRITEATHSHVVVTGPSGAGKSVLLLKLVAPRLAPSKHVLTYNVYDKILENVLADIGNISRSDVNVGKIMAKYEQVVKANRCNVRRALEPDFSSTIPAVSELWEEMRQYLQDTLRATEFYFFIFDQTERYINIVRTEIEQGGNNINGIEVLFFVNMIRFLRYQDNCRTVFAIRSEFLYDSIDFLDAIANHRSEASGVVTYFMCPGINSVSAPDGSREVRASFRRIPFAGDLFANFERIVGIDNRAYSNTFMAQLFGFLIESFYTSNINIKTMLAREADRSLALHYFFDHLLNDYFRQSRSTDMMALFKAVLFTIAIENNATGQSITTARAAALAHIPEEYVGDVVEFLKDIGVLYEESRGGDPAYRFAHDLISDYIIESEQLAIDPALKNEIRGLCERSVELQDLTKVDPYANLIVDWTSRINLPLIVIWGFFVFGALRLKVEVCNWIYPWFLRYMPQTQGCLVLDHTYLPVYFMHVIWLTFIYHIQRDYMRHTLGYQWLRYASASAPVGGAVLAVLVSQSPALFIIPVAFGGMVMALVLIAGSLCGSYVGRAAKENITWGVLTFMNMIISASATLVVWLVFWDDKNAIQFWDYVARGLSLSAAALTVTRQGIAVTSIYILSAFMIYFWAHIRRGQQSRISLAARLALYDRARLDRGQ